MSSLEDFFYNGSITVLQGPPLYLFNENNIREYQESLKRHILISSERDSSISGKSSSSVDSNSLKVKWKHEDKLDVPGLQNSLEDNDVSYEVNMIFIRLGSKNIQKFCLLTRLHVSGDIEEESVQEGETYSPWSQQRKIRQTKLNRLNNQRDYLTRKVILLANSNSQILNFVVTWLGQTLDSYFKPIMPLSSEFMLSQYDKIYQYLKSLLVSGEIVLEVLQTETSFIVFDVSSIVANAAKLENEDQGKSSSDNNNNNSLQEISVSVLGRDILGYMSQKTKSQDSNNISRNMTLSEAVIHHYYNITGIDLGQVPIKKITTSALNLSSKGDFKIFKRGLYWNDNDNANFWKFIQSIAEQEK